MPTLSSGFCDAAAHTALSTLSLHDALPIFDGGVDVDVVTLQLAVPALEVDAEAGQRPAQGVGVGRHHRRCHVGLEVDMTADRKSTRLNSSHRCISYAVFCLKKKMLQRRERP